MHPIIMISAFVVIVIFIALLFRAEIQHIESDRLRHLEDQKMRNENREKIRQLHSHVIRKQTPKND